MKTQMIGKLGELLAKKYFLHKKYSLVIMNYHCKFGELDLVLKSSLEPKTLLFCEIKTRTSENFIHPSETLQKRQISKILKTIHVFLLKNGYNNYNWRLDLLVVLFDFKNTAKRLIHYKNILLS